MLKENTFFRNLQARIGNYLKQSSITPNQITFFSVVLAAFGAFVFSQSYYFVGVVFFLAAVILDGIDGAIARAKGLVSPVGAFFDGIADRIVEFFIILSLLSVNLPTFIFPAQYWLFSLLFFGTCMTAFIKAYAEHQQVLSHSVAVSMSGLLERAERTLLLLLACFLVAFSHAFYALMVILLAVILSIFTVIQRLHFVLSIKST